MKIVVFLSILFWMISSTLRCQTYWGQTTLSGSTNEAIDIESDNLGNLYVAGYFSGGTSFQLGSPQINSQGNTDIYISKYNPLGVLQWVKTFGGSFSDKPTDLALDNLGNILITGEYFGAVNFGATLLTSVGSSKDVFVLKLDNSGNVIWAISEGDAGSENAFGISVDGLNNVIITGQFQGNSNIGGMPLSSAIDPLTNSPNNDLFISKYTDLGANLWVKTGVSKYADRGLALAVDSQNDIFLTGQFSDTFNLAGTIINNIDFNVGLVAKISAAGTLQWLNLLKAGNTVPYDVEVNSTDEPIVIGDFTGSLQYITNTATTPISASNPNKIFAIKIANTGTHVWNKTYSSDSELSTRAVSIDAANNVFLTGYFECGWTEFQTGANPSATFNSVGFKDPYLISINDAGTELFVKTFGSNKNDVGLGIAFDDQQFPVICGSHTFDLNIPTGAGTYLNSGSPFDFSSATPLNYQFYAYLEGDLTANSFLTNAVHGAIPDYNYFKFQPIDSTYGQVSAGFDTVYFCNLTLLTYSTYTLEDYGPGYNYLWNTGSTDNEITIWQNGVYTVQVEREDGCSMETDTVVAIQQPTPPLPLMWDNLGIANGTTNYPTYSLCSPDSVTIWYTDLCPGCTISINQGFITDTLPHTYTQAGQYNVLISNGVCTSINDFLIILDTAEIIDPIQPYLYFIEDTDHNDTISVCPGDTLSVHAYDSLTNPPLPTLNQFHDEPFDYYVFTSQNTFLPYNGQGNNQFINAFRPDSSGWYVFEYFASIGYNNACGTDTTYHLIYDSVYIDMAASPGINILITSADSLCPSSSTFLTASPSFSNFVWTGPNIVFNSPANDSIQVASPGLYQYQGMFADSTTGCSAFIIADFDLQEIQPPSITTNPSDGIICPGDSVLLSVSSDFASFNWVDPFGNSPSNTNTLYANTVGVYFCNVVDSNGCSLTSTPAELNQYTVPGVFADPQNIICENTPLTIGVSSSGSPSITWINPSSGGSSSQITVSQPGTYICEIEQCGITTIDSVDIIDGSFSINLIASDTLLCYNDSAYLAVDTGYTYVWTNLPDTNNFTYASTSGFYSVTATNQYGCEAYSDTLTILNAPFSYPPNVDDVVVCYGDSITLIDNGFTVVYWYDGDTNFLASSPAYDSPPLFQNQVLYAAYNAQGCPPAFDDINVTVIQPLTSNAILGDTIICAGDSTILYLANNQGAMDWYVDDVLTVTDTSVTIYSIPGSSPQEIKIVNSNACFTDSISIHVYSIPVPVLSVSPDTVTICGTGSQTVMATSNLDSIVWATPFGDEYGNSIDISQTYPHATIVQVQGYDTNACVSNAASVYVEVTDSLDITISSSPTVCASDFVTLEANADATNFIWIGPNSTINNDIITFPLGANQGTFTAQVTDSLGCIWTESLEIYPTGGSLPSLPDTICCFTDWLRNVSLDTNFIYSDEDGFTFDTLAMADNSYYTVVVTDSLGCENALDIFVTIVSCDIRIPNVITSNFDGINDFFVLKFSCNQNNDNLKIFNRWGNLVYEKSGYDNDWNGDNLVNGVYFYLYDWDTTDSDSRVSQGFVTILR